METNFKEKIETLMKGKNSFIIFLAKPTQGKFQGAIQVGNFKKELEVMPDVDKIQFSEDKNEVNIEYTRVYSDFPSSVSNFALSEIKKVEEVPPTK